MPHGIIFLMQLNTFFSTYFFLSFEKVEIDLIEYFKILMSYSLLKAS